MMAASNLDHDRRGMTDQLVDLAPFDLAALEAPPRPARNLRASSVRTQPQGAAESVILGLSVGVVLQMVVLDSKSCVIRLESNGRVGTLTLIDGDLIDAATESLTGELAVYELVTWTGTRQTIQALTGPVPRTIYLPVVQLLIEAMRRADESEERARQGIAVGAEVGEPTSEAPRWSFQKEVVTEAAKEVVAEAAPAAGRAAPGDAATAEVLTRVSAIPGVRAALVCSWDELFAPVLPAAMATDDPARSAMVDAARGMAKSLARSGHGVAAFEESVCNIGKVRIVSRAIATMAGCVAIVVADADVYLNVIDHAIAG